ncbi:VCBS repeat-containing protein [Nitrospira sp. MA-1]|nr:VCBS repeat-containing protein [Nitrospira sp. MA-1]
MFTPRLLRLRIVFLIALLIVSGPMAGSPPVLAQQPGDTSGCSSADNSNDPCFSKVTDILQGQRSLLPVDDLVTTYGQPNTSGPANVSIIVSPTKNGQAPIENASQYEISHNVAASATAVGRMFNLSRDVIVTATQGIVTVRDQGPPIIVKAFPLTETPVPNGITMADFNGDGFDDFVLAQTDLGKDGKWHGYLEFVTANDVNDLNQGLNAGPYTSVDFPVGANALGTASITSGDFDGDGMPEVIVGWPVHGGATKPGIEIEIYRFSRQNGQFHLAGSRQFSPSPNEDRPPYDSYTQIHILAGNFTGAAPLPGDNGARDQLALTWNDETTLLMASGHVDVDTSQTPATLTPVMKITGLLGVGSIGNMTAARLNWLSNQEQIVFGYTSSWKKKLINLVFIGGKNSAGPTPIVLGDIELTNLRGCATGYPDLALRDFAIGNYDQTDHSGTIEIPKTLQLSILYATYCTNGSSPNLRLNQAVYGIAFDGNGKVTLSTPQDNGSFPLEIHPLNNQTAPDVLYSFPASLTAGDLQGRSLLLGTPTKATVNAHIQPDTILGLPPMHLDWVNPVGATTPSAVNVTVFPGTYNSQYNFVSSSSSAVSRQSTTSFTYATDESAEQQISYGIPDIASVSVSLKEAAKQMYKNTAGKAFNTYSKQSFDLSASTVFDDLVAATIKRLNIYSYPVIGHCIKDSGAGDSAAGENSACPAGERPMILQFSGPDQIIHLQPTEGAGLEWYQPPQQPGQAFSYPGSFAQLEQEQPQTASGTSALQLLSGANSAWGSQGGNELVKVNWTEGNGSNVSAGSVSTHSFDVSVSVSGSANIEGLGLSGGASFAYNQSRSSSTLNTTATSFADSTGITLNRGLGPDATTTNSAYLYEGQSYIFGQLPTAGTIDDRTPAETVKGDGFITAGYAADPLSTSGIQAGDWWKQTYVLPDIAFNHPQRWQQTIPQGTDGERVAFNCPVGFSSSFASPGCTPNGQTPTPANLATNPFYQMKGLFVTPGTSAEGPQITRITEGNSVMLRARVYNYSLTNLSAGSTVRVRFYAQPWDNQRGQFAAGSGPHGFARAIAIGEDVLNPIPALCGGSSTEPDDPCTDQNARLNWAYAKATWDPPALPDSVLASYWKFWVVAFPEDGSGGVPELADHGLTSIPPTDVNSLADIPVQTYSNNLGFYNQVFSVVAKTAPSPGAEPTSKTLKTASANAEKDGAPVTQVPINDRVQVRADYHVPGADLDDVLVLFYDGDPAQGAQLFDMENVPRIPADSDFVTRVPFQPRKCGLHTLFVKAIPADGTALPATQQATLKVTMDPVAKLGRMSNVITRLQSDPESSTLPADWSLSGQAPKQMLAQLEAVQRLFQQGQSLVATNRLIALEHYVDAQRDKNISVELADALDKDIKQLLDCAPA